MATADDLLDHFPELRADFRRAFPPNIMTSTEAADYIGCKEVTLRTWRKDGFGPPYSQPTERTVRYLREDIDAWLKEHRNG